MPGQPFDSYSSHRQNQSSVHLTSSYDDEVKAPYDDLIDEYAAPYSVNSTHQTYNLGTGPISPNASRQQSQSHRRTGSNSHKIQLSKHSEDTSIDHSTIAYPPTPLETEPKVPFWRKLIPASLACRLYLAVLLVETAVDLIVEADLLVRVLDGNNQVKELLDGERKEDTTDNGIAVRKITIYLVLFSLAHVFQLVMALDAVYHRNTLQFGCLTLFNTALLAYSVVQIGEVNEAVGAFQTSGVSTIPINVLTIIIPCVIGISTLAYCALAYKIYHEFGWQVYKFLGADRRIKKMYANFQVYECIVKFDVFFWAGFSIQFLDLVLDKNDWEYWVTVAALPLSLLLLWEGHLAARHEAKWMMATFMSGCVGAMVYFCYKLIKVLIYKKTDYQFTWKSLSIFSAIAILLLIITFVYAIIVMRNFGRGLKASMSGKNNTHERVQSTNVLGATSKIRNRMSIE